MLSSTTVPLMRLDIHAKYLKIIIMGHIKDFFKDLSPLQKVVFSTLFFIALFANLEKLITSQATLFFETDESLQEIVVEVNGLTNRLDQRHFFQSSSQTMTGFYLDVKQNSSIRIILPHPEDELLKNVYLIQNSLLKTEAQHLNIEDSRLIEKIGKNIYGWRESFLHNQFNLNDDNKTIEFSKYHHIHIFFYFFLVLMIFSAKGWIEFYKTNDSLFKILFTTQLLLFFYFVNKIQISNYEIQLSGSSVWYKLNWLPPSLQWANYYLPGPSASNLAFGVHSDFILLVSAKVAYILDHFYILPRTARNFRLAQHLLIFLSFGLIYRFASQAIGKYVLILFTVVAPIFISFIEFNDIVLSSVFLITAYTIFISTPKKSPYFYTISLIALFISINTTFPPLVTVPAFCFLFSQKFSSYRDREFFRLIFLLIFALPIVLYRSLFNIFDEITSGQFYDQVIANRLDIGTLGFSLEHYHTFSITALALVFTTVFTASIQEKWFNLYFWLFPINILAIFIHFL